MGILSRLLLFRLRERQRRLSYQSRLPQPKVLPSYWGRLSKNKISCLKRLKSHLTCWERRRTFIRAINPPFLNRLTFHQMTSAHRFLSSLSIVLRWLYSSNNWINRIWWARGTQLLKSISAVSRPLVPLSWDLYQLTPFISSSCYLNWSASSSDSSPNIASQSWPTLPSYLASLSLYNQGEEEEEETHQRHHSISTSSRSSCTPRSRWYILTSYLSTTTLEEQEVPIRCLTRRDKSEVLNKSKRFCPLSAYNWWFDIQNYIYLNYLSKLQNGILSWQVDRQVSERDN